MARGGNCLAINDVEPNGHVTKKKVKCVDPPPPTRGAYPSIRLVIRLGSAALVAAQAQEGRWRRAAPDLANHGRGFDPRTPAQKAQTASR